MNQCLTRVLKAKQLEMDEVIVNFVSVQPFGANVERCLGLGYYVSALRGAPPNASVQTDLYFYFDA